MIAKLFKHIISGDTSGFDSLLKLSNKLDKNDFDSLKGK